MRWAALLMHVRISLASSGADAASAAPAATIEAPATSLWVITEKQERRPVERIADIDISPCEMCTRE